ncbi:catalase [Actinacidiphila alni]|uniref:Catalase-related peroxidase n=1 Tax=Actinacidiphila alni TaxID=380248 RepID=A0A1I2LQJ1_9ACTN|nr:catalase family peroxidase [Actinacidiphila alni]SFF81772.1 catalase [Actinacidiphila alni]
MPSTPVAAATTETSIAPTTAAEVVDSMERMHGKHPGFRRSGARGACFTGTFTPTGEAAALTTAGHLQDIPVPAVARFSNSEGNPAARDGVPVARGMAVRFALPDGDETDLIAMTVPLFVASNPRQFLDLTEALRPDPATGGPDPAKVQAYLGAHPHLVEAVTQCPPVPVSYATAAYWAVHAFVWTDAAGNRQPVRYRWEPEAGRAELSEEEAAARTDHYLTDELRERLGRGPVVYTLRVQLGEDGDPTDDPSVAWPQERTEITAGRLELTGPVDDQRLWDTQRFSPVRLTDGIELSDDPVLAFRANAYAESYRRRSREG